MPSTPDWRNAAAYAYLQDLNRSELAWEFLRRNPNYHRDFRAAVGPPSEQAEFPRRIAQHWGLRFPIDPDLRADRATLIWLPQLDPTTVVVAPAPNVFGDASSISNLNPAFDRRAVEGEYWLVNGVDGRLPTVLISGVRAGTPAAVVIPLDRDFALRTDAAARLWRRATGRSPGRSPDHLTQQRRQRLGLSLRALDGRLDGEAYRAIARGLFGVPRVPGGRAWKTHDLRDRTIRLVRRGLDLMQGGYLKLLRHPRRSNNT